MNIRNAFRPDSIRNALIGAALLVPLWLPAQDVVFNGPRAIDARLTPTGVIDIAVGDLDSDQDPDILAWVRSGNSQDGYFLKYFNTNGLGAFVPEDPFGENSALLQMQLEDLDYDGDLEILAMTQDSLYWLENSLGTGNFLQRPALFTVTFPSRITAMKFADLDGDENTDILVGLADSSVVNDTMTYHSELRWLEKEGSSYVDRMADLFNFASIDTADTSSMITNIQCADLDGDGDMDVLTSLFSASARLAVDFNTDGLGGFDGTGRAVYADSTFGGMVIEAQDFDNDGDLDLLSRYNETLIRRIVWHENTDGLGTLDTARVICNTFASRLNATTSDVDQDGAMDIIVTDYLQRNVGWYQNIPDSLGNFFLIDLVGNTFWYPLDAIVVDVDSDGDMDVITSVRFQENGALEWYKNNSRLTGVDPEPALPRSPVLASVHPNPFNPTTQVTVELDRAGALRLSLFNMLGQVVAVPVDDMLPAGRHTMQIDGSGLSSGLYFLTAEAEGRAAETRQLMLLK